MGILNEKTLSNHKKHRELSDKLDNIMNWNQETKHKSKLRGFLHGSYHLLISIGKLLVFNQEGSYIEYKRAKIQYSRIIGNNRNN